ncbi:MAG: putative 4-mercaptohistidine N1-methyltransferase [SAR324 cluster bacterium]|nr:putative 4-mercaptohistidine N1-methyltransferase [SAR324 cluster bacterium]
MSDSDQVYETSETLSMYLEFHYGPSCLNVDNFPQRCVSYARKYVANADKGLALDLGCAVGRSCFELARDFKHVTGVDLSCSFINTCKTLQKTGTFSWSVQEEGLLRSQRSINLENLGLFQNSAEIDFVQADVQFLEFLPKNYNLVLACNLIDRLSSPAKFLQQIQQRLVSGGILFITTPCTWLEEFTPRDKWLGGFHEDGRFFNTFEAMSRIFESSFQLLAPPEPLEFVIRETSRKFQHTFSEMTVWKKR